MTVTAEQWAAVAVDLKTTVEDLHARIAKLDERDAGDKLARAYNLPPLHFDRDLDPLTLGEWAMLYEARSYKFIRSTVLPNRYWIATIWQGINEEGDEPPVVMESAVFLLHSDRTQLPPPSHREHHATLQDALDRHDRLVRQWVAPKAEESARS